MALLRAGGMLSMLAFVAFLSQWLAKDEFGVLATLVSLATLAAAFGSFGQAEMIIRTMAARQADGHLADASKAPAEAIGLAVWVSAACGSVVAASFALTGQGMGVAVAAILLTMALAVMTTLAGAARMEGRYTLALAPRDIVWRILTVMAVGGVLLAGRQLQAATAGLIAALAAWVCALWQVRALELEVRSLVRPSAHVLESAYLRASGSLAISMLAIVAMSTIDVVAIGILVSPDAAATYFPVNRIALLASFAALPIQLVVEQRFASQFAAGDHVAMQRTSNHATLLLIVLTLALAGIIAGGFPLYRSFFPTAGELSWVLMTILVAGSVIGSATGMAEPLLIMTGHQAACVRTNVVVALLTALAAVLAALQGSLVGVAFAVAGGEVVRKLVLAVTARRLTGILPIKSLGL